MSRTGPPHSFVEDVCGCSVEKAAKDALDFRNCLRLIIWILKIRNSGCECSLRPSFGKNLRGDIRIFCTLRRRFAAGWHVLSTHRFCPASSSEASDSTVVRPGKPRISFHPLFLPSVVSALAVALCG